MEDPTTVAEIDPERAALGDQSQRFWTEFLDNYLKLDDPEQPKPKPARLAYLRRFEHFGAAKYLSLLEPTPEGRHYNEFGAGGAAVILGGGWTGSSSFNLFSNRLSSGSGSV